MKKEHIKKEMAARARARAKDRIERGYFSRTPSKVAIDNSVAKEMIRNKDNDLKETDNVQKYADFITAQNKDKLQVGGIWGSPKPEVKVPEKKEDPEQLNEIGNTQKGQNTLKRYVLKAAGKLNLNARLAGFHNRAAYDGNQTDSGKDNEKNYSRVANNRRMGIQKAVFRLREEAKEKK